MRTKALVVAAGIAAGCELPQRDNANDPQNRPVAVIEILQGADAVTSVPRTSPVELSAAASVADEGPLAVEWFVREVAASPDLEEEWTPLGEGAAFPADEPFTHTFLAANVFTDPFTDEVGTTGISRWEVRGVVTDEGTGGKDETSARIDVVNRAPELDVRPFWAFSPGGRSWSASPDPFVVEIPVPVSDPDGEADAPTVTWEIVEGGQGGLAVVGSSGTFAVTLPLEQARMSILVAATDGAGASDSAIIELQVGDLPWLASGDRIVRAAPPSLRRPMIDREGGQPSAARIASVTGDGVLTIEMWDLGSLPAQWFLVERDRYGRLQGGFTAGTATSFPSTSFLVGTALADDGDVWMAVLTASEGLYRFEPGNATPVTSILVNLPQSVDPSLAERWLAHDPSTGSLWTLRQVTGGLEVVRFSAGGVEEMSALIAGANTNNVRSITLDGGGGAWVLLRDFNELYQTGIAVHLDAAGAELDRFEPVDDAPWIDLFAVDPPSGRLYLSGRTIDYSGQGYVLVLAEDGSVVESVALPERPTDLSVNPADGSVWAVLPDAGLLARVDVDGIVSLHETNLGNPGGAPAYGNPAVFVEDATVWTVGAPALPIDLVMLESSTAVEMEAAIVEQPHGIAVAPGSSTAVTWQLGGSAVLVDALGAVVRAWEIPGGVATAAVDAETDDVWLASPWTSSTPSRLWRVPAGARIHGGAGTPVEIATLPMANVMALSVDPGAAALCLSGATGDGSSTLTSDAVVARLATDGTTLWSEPFTSIAGAPFVAAALDGTDACAALGPGPGGPNAQSLLRVLGPGSTTQMDLMTHYGGKLCNLGETAYCGFRHATQLALDGFGAPWIVDSLGDELARFTWSTNTMTTNYVQFALAASEPRALAIDPHSGLLWVSHGATASSGSSLVRYSLESAGFMSLFVPTGALGAPAAHTMVVNR